MGVTYTTSSAATYEPIQKITASGSTGVISFTSIPNTYTDLIIVFNGSQGSSGTTPIVQMTYNTDAYGASGYSCTTMRGNGSATASGRYGSQWLFVIPLTAGTQWTDIIQIFNYANTSTYKTALIRHDSDTTVDATVGLWSNTAAINTVTLSTSGGNYNSGSTFTLYGIKAA